MLTYTLSTSVRVTIDNALAPGNWKNQLNGARDEILDAYNAWAPTHLLSLDSVTNSGWVRTDLDDFRDQANISIVVVWQMNDVDPAALHQSVESILKPSLAAAFQGHFRTLLWITGNSNTWDDAIDIDGETTGSFHRAKGRRGQGHINT